MATVDFATFCYAKDAHRLHAPKQLARQVLSNDYSFSHVIVIHQQCYPLDYNDSPFRDCYFPVNMFVIDDLDKVLKTFGIDIDKPQYVSEIDKVHTWKNHTANHLAVVMHSSSDYIVFADNDCWMVKQPDSWVKRGIEILEQNPDVFIVSPNDGEPERRTQVISQQMFMARTDGFRQADFNQPGYSGNPRDYPEMPEYHAMLEGRIHYHCVASGKYRYVLPPEYRYFHHNRLNEDGTYKTNYSDYGIIV